MRSPVASMIMLRKMLLLLLVSPAVLFTRGLRAQSASVQATPCSYDACALRQDGGAIRRGLGGENDANIGVFSEPNLSSIVRGDSATAYARLFNREYGHGNRMFWGGLVLT